MKESSDEQNIAYYFILDGFDCEISQHLVEANDYMVKRNRFFIFRGDSTFHRPGLLERWNGEDNIISGPIPIIAKTIPIITSKLLAVLTNNGHMKPYMIISKIKHDKIFISGDAFLIMLISLFIILLFCHIKKASRVGEAPLCNVTISFWCPPTSFTRIYETIPDNQSYLPFALRLA